MIDNLDYGARDSFPSAYNYNYASSMYLDDSHSPQGAARAYTEDTRPDKMDGCEPCKGFSSIYYDKCYAKEGNQCIGRSYPQCQRGDPYCTQMEQKQKQLYPPDKIEEDEYIDEDDGYRDEFSKFSVKGKQKEKFEVGGYELTDQRVILIAIIFVCLIMLMNGGSKKTDSLPYTYTFVQDGYSPYIYS